jgi:glutathione S-transferase
MRLIGLLDSPYVRRVAISLALMELPFTHEFLSVFRNYDAFAAINPVVKAPTLVADDGTTLMESTLILAYLEDLAAPERRLTPTAQADRPRAQRVIGLALAASDKAVQLVYERDQRPPEARHQPWIDRVRGQMLAALGLLEGEMSDGGAWLFGPRPLQADVTAAVVWRFTQFALPGAADPDAYPGLAALSARAEALPEFRAAPPE